MIIAAKKRVALKLERKSLKLHWPIASQIVLLSGATARVLGSPVLRAGGRGVERMWGSTSERAVTKATRDILTMSPQAHAHG